MNINFTGTLERHTWKSIGTLVQSIYPELASIIDELSPEDSFTLYMDSLY